VIRGRAIHPVPLAGTGWFHRYDQTCAAEIVHARSTCEGALGLPDGGGRPPDMQNVVVWTRTERRASQALWVDEIGGTWSPVGEAFERPQETGPRRQRDEG